MNITIKSLPDEVGASLKQAAAHAHRSLNGEIIHRLIISLAENDSTPKISPKVSQTPDAMANAWESLGGRWKSDLSVEDEIASLYENRSAGREADLFW